MFRDILETVADFAKKTVNSRLFVLGVIFSSMFMLLIVKLFNLQIIEGKQAMENYISMTEETLTTAGTRGNIYDCNGKVLAYNKLVYSVTIQDIGAYSKARDKNAMLLRLVQILEKHGETVQGKFEVAINSNGEMVYTSSSEDARKRFLRDYYGRKSVDDLDNPENNYKYPSKITARELFEKAKKDGELDQMKDDKGNPVMLSDQEALDIINIKYSMRLISYRKYESSLVSSQVSEETVADILEHTAVLPGVNIEESTIRVYNDSIYFSPVIGYTGKVQEDKLEELQKKRPDYDLNDIVGRTGIEYFMEDKLQGTKGKKTIYKDSMGRIRETRGETEATAGSDLYLSIDYDLQVGIYHLVEQSLAGILVHQMVNEDVEVTDSTDPSKIKIPVKDAYYQLVNNNVLSLKHMESEEASPVEVEINRKFMASREQILTSLRNELMSEHPTLMKDLPKDMMAYMVYIYKYLSEPTVGIIDRKKIEPTSEEYLAWKNDETSLRDYLYAGIAKGWVDTTKLITDSKYTSADDTFKVLVDYVLVQLEDDINFTKEIYRYLVHNEVVTGNELCLALYAQGVLPNDEEEIAALSGNGPNYAFTFMIKKISNLEITPAQLALDPCTAGVVVTDDKTGKIKALVSYPGYDNNRTGDGAYYNQLLEDMSLPLYNNATQTAKAPGSTFKPITAVAALEEKVINTTDIIECTGRYDAVSLPIKCWIYPGHHGPLDIIGGIENSCNFFFAELAHRLSMDEDMVYSQDQGIAVIREYAKKFGLDHTSGVEIEERAPEITNRDPERSAMGQGTHAYTNVQLARYVAAIASRGNVFELSLLEKLTDSSGNVIEEYPANISSHIDVADTTWDAVQQGMRNVVTNGSGKPIFRDLEVNIAGKTGTAQESKTRANHAFFISYAPFENPEICVTVNIPNGYSSSNAANIAKNVYRYYYGYTDLEKILNAGALDAVNVNIRD